MPRKEARGHRRPDSVDRGRREGGATVSPKKLDNHYFTAATNLCFRSALCCWRTVEWGLTWARIYKLLPVRSIDGASKGAKQRIEGSPTLWTVPNWRTSFDIPLTRSLTAAAAPPSLRTPYSNLQVALGAEETAAEVAAIINSI